MRVSYVALEGRSGAGRLYAAAGALPQMALDREHGRAGQVVVVDGLEHLRAAEADVARLLNTVPALRLLAACRVSGALAGIRAQELQLAPLPVQELQGRTRSSRLAPSIRMFMDRKAERGAVAGTRAQAVEVVSRLDGLPLAIEAAAIAGDGIAPRALSANLDRVLGLSIEGDDRSPLRASLDRTYALLTPDEQSAFRRLGVFEDDWTLDDAVDLLISDVDGTLKPPQGLRAYGVLHRIAQHGLLQMRKEGPALRFHVLGVYRRYAAMLREVNHEVSETRELLLQCALRLSEQAREGLGGTDAPLWRALLMQRAATIAGAVGECKRADDGDSAAVILWNLRELVAAGLYFEAGRWVEAALTCSTRQPANRGKLLVLSAAMSKPGAAAVRSARRGISLLRLQPELIAAAMAVLPTAVREIVASEPPARRSKARAS